MVGAKAAPIARAAPRDDGGPAAGRTGAAGGGDARASRGPGRLRDKLWARMRVECEFEIAEFKVCPDAGQWVTACEASGCQSYGAGRTRTFDLWDLATEAMDGDGGELYGPGGELSVWGHEVYRRAVAVMGPPPPDGDARWTDSMQGRYTVPAREGAGMGSSGLGDAAGEGWEPDGGGDHSRVAGVGHDDGGGGQQVKAEHYDDGGGHYDDGGGGHGQVVEDEHHDDGGGARGQQVEAEHYDDGGGHYGDGGGGHGQQVEDEHHDDGGGACGQQVKAEHYEDGGGGHGQVVEDEHHDDGGGGRGQKVKAEHYDDGGGHCDDGGGGHGQQVEDEHHDDGGGGHGQRVEDDGGGGHGRRVEVERHDDDGGGGGQPVEAAYFRRSRRLAV